jgi:endonuclease YncB( thermonuclease family)
VVALLCATGAVGQTLIGRVVHVVDGDTFDLLVGGRTTYRIRLAGCDTPEPGQPFSRRAKEHLGEVLARRSTVTADCYKEDRNGRKVCRVPVAGKDACLWHLQAGLAWWFERFANEQTPEEIQDYSNAQAKARAARIGLWSDPDPIAPWTYRSQRQSGKPAAR